MFNKLTPSDVFVNVFNSYGIENKDYWRMEGSPKSAEELKQFSEIVASGI